MVEKTLDERFVECVQRALQSMQAARLEGKYIWGREKIDAGKGLQFSEAGFRDSLFQEMMRDKREGEWIGCEASYPEGNYHVDIAYDCEDVSKPLFRKPVEIKLWHADGGGSKSTAAVIEDIKKLKTYAPDNPSIQPAVLVVASSFGNLETCLKNLSDKFLDKSTEIPKNREAYLSSGCDHCGKDKICAALIRVLR